MTMLGAVDVWMESPLVHVFPDSVPGKTSERSARIHAAGGERESFQLCIRAKQQKLEHVEAQPTPMEVVGEPEIRRVGFLQIEKPSARATSDNKLWPDPLLDLKPFDVQENETAILWVTYAVPVGARPGTYSAKIAITASNDRKREIDVKVVVFDFAIPEVSSLRAVLTLDREAIRRVYGIANADLDKWKPIYDAFSHDRFSFNIWDGGNLVTVKPNEPPDVHVLEDHIEYAAQSAKMNTIDLSAGEKGVLVFSEPAKTETEDPLQSYLIEMAKWLREKGRANQAYIQPMPLPERSKWALARDEYFRVKRDYPRINRLIVGDVHPYFELDAEIWAVPLRHFDPYAMARLHDGVSLIDKVAYPADEVTASSSGKIPDPFANETLPQDAYDGCLFSYWISANPPSRHKHEWLELHFPESVTARSFKVIWKSGFEGANPTVIVDRKNIEKRLSDITWRPHAQSDPFSQSWADAELKKPITFSSIQFDFTGTVLGGPVGITEISIGTGKPLPPERTEPVETWLYAFSGDFPSFAADVHRVEARMFPWVCYGHMMAGFLSRNLNHWPEGWTALAAAQPLIWTGGGTGADFLFYPGPDKPIPSIRSELLRDGLEDYEYLVALERALRDHKTNKREAIALAARRFYSAFPKDNQIDDYRSMLLKDHKAIGQLLSELAKHGKL